MKQFDFYEFAGVLAPGATFLFGAALLVPEIKDMLQPPQGFTIGDLGLFTILAYVMGHLLQAVGNGLEWCWWKIWGGKPTDWPKAGKHDLIAESQRERLRIAIQRMLALPEDTDPFTISGGQWTSVVRQLDAEIPGADRRRRIETFNGNYGLNRGLASALSCLAVLALAISPSGHWKLAAVCAVGGAIAVYRMHRFGCHYGREMFVQYLSSSQREASGSLK